MKVMIIINCIGDGFVTDGNPSPESGVAEVLSDVVDMLRSGTSLSELHTHQLRSRTGDKVGAIMISDPQDT